MIIASVGRSYQILSAVRQRCAWCRYIRREVSNTDAKRLTLKSPKHHASRCQTTAPGRSTLLLITPRNRLYVSSPECTRSLFDCIRTFFATTFVFFAVRLADTARLVKAAASAVAWAMSCPKCAFFHACVKRGSNNEDRGAGRQRLRRLCPAIPLYRKYVV